jgi:2-polyprenyl-3-methyl-5-hydroxy-6-metoxy-1,4-benzoquinol methylase
MDDVTRTLKEHYSGTFQQYGPTSKGVDWGRTADLELRYEKMLNVVLRDTAQPVSLLDVGCGYGGLWQYISEQKLQLNYTGIDVCENMIGWAKENQRGAEFLHGDMLSYQAQKPFDYIVANGVLTQKLDVSIEAMNLFTQKFVKAIFNQCRVGIAFNIMTTKVNFMVPNLYYRNPAEFMAWCMAEITPWVKIDHAYGLYEYTTYLYKADVG